MRVAVVGLGGVGGYIAASLAKTSHEVIGFARGEHLNVVQRQGLEIVEDELCWSQKVDARALEDLDGYFEGYFDIVLFCVKSYDLKNSYEHIKSHTDKHSILLSFSNGVSNGDMLRELSDSTVLDACVYILAHREKAGVIRKKGKVFAAVFGGNNEATLRVDSLFKEAGLRTKNPEDIKTAIWKKYIFISAFATLTAYYSKSIGYIYENHVEEAKILLKEIASVANVVGVEIQDEVEKSLQTASKVPYDSSTSMALDFKNRRRDELESLSAYVVHKAKEFHVEVPLMKKMYAKLLETHIE
jgi:2-dehydropantoate 2-reductase